MLKVIAGEVDVLAPLQFKWRIGGCVPEQGDDRLLVPERLAQFVVGLRLALGRLGRQYDDEALATPDSLLHLVTPVLPGNQPALVEPDVHSGRSGEQLVVQFEGEVDRVDARVAEEVVAPGVSV